MGGRFHGGICNGLVSVYLFTYGTYPRQQCHRRLATSTLYLFAGIPGTFHHLYFSGTPVSIMAVGASFSALEVVPLALVGFEAWETWRMGRRADWTPAGRMSPAPNRHRNRPPSRHRPC